MPERPFIRLSLSRQFRAPSTGDFDGDGDVDLLLRTAADEEPTWMLRADGAGGFSNYYDATDEYGMWSDRWSDLDRIAHSGDFDGDGQTDLFLQGRRASYATLLLSASSGTDFNNARLLDNNYGLSRLLLTSDDHEAAVGDFDGDGADDVLLRGRTAASRTWVLCGKLGGGFHDVVDISDMQTMGAPLWADEHRELAIGDWDGDGADDVMLRGRDANSASFVLYLAEDLRLP